jgi:hypothetical protein
MVGLVFTMPLRPNRLRCVERGRDITAQVWRDDPGRSMKAKSSSKSLNRNPKFAAGVERALIRAEETARRAARMYGTPLYVWENGKVVAKRP